MKLQRIEQLPKYHGDYVSRALEDYEVREIPTSVDEAWYWYGEGDYCGAGQIIMRTDAGLYHHHDMGHCSCYGPTDGIANQMENAGRTLPELKEHLKAMLPEVQCLFDLIETQ